MREFLRQWVEDEILKKFLKMVVSEELDKTQFSARLQWREPSVPNNGRRVFKLHERSEPKQTLRLTKWANQFQVRMSYNYRC